jgi:hypothetical protein
MEHPIGVRIQIFAGITLILTIPVNAGRQIKNQLEMVAIVIFVDFY